MNWAKSFHSIAKQAKCSMSVVTMCQNSAFSIEKNLFASLQADRGYVTAVSPKQAGSGREHLQDTLNSARYMGWRVKLPCGLSRNIFAQRKYAMLISCQCSDSKNNALDLSRDFFVQLWIADKKRKTSEERERRKVLDRVQYVSQTNTQFPPGRQFSEASVTNEGSYSEMKPFLRRPPTSQSVTGALKPSSPEEAKVAPLLARSNLLITRDIEWANLSWGLQQESRYLIVDVCYPQTPVGAIREQSNFFMRQLLRTRRPFVAYIYDGLGNELFRVRRPFWWITSSIFAEINGKEIGVVHRRWHLWRRIYDLYLGNKQFAVVENPGLWNWTFTLEDIDGAVLAQIDRKWRGAGYEILTDAGQYVIRFGTADSSFAPVNGIEELEVKRTLTLSERAVAVALAVSLDCDYFSRHGGWFIPFLVATE